MRIIVRIILILSLATLLWGCPENECPEGVDAMLVDYSHLGGCSWIIELPDGERLQPLNLNDYEMAPTDSMLVRVSFSVADDMAGICMVGTMVHIQCITPR